MKVGKYDKEADYVANKTQEYNKKEAGKGDTWAKAWVDDRKYRFEPKFKDLFTEYSEKTESKKGKYTLILKTIFTEPGYNVGISRKNAQIDAIVLIVETANRNNVIAKLSLDNALGRTFGGYDFDTGERIAEAYADAGKALGKYLKQ
jgi:DNA repair exonuclease SbcCD nuclease subunit